MTHTNFFFFFFKWFDITCDGKRRKTSRAQTVFSLQVTLLKKMICKNWWRFMIFLGARK